MMRLLVACAALAAGCIGSAAMPKDLGGGAVDAGGPLADLASQSPADLAGQTPWDFATSADLATVPAIPAGFNDPQLAGRQLSYGLALRTASLKLVGDLPTSDEQTQLAAAMDPAAFYASRIDAYLADPRFASQLIGYWRNTFVAGGQVANMPSFDTAATFAAELVVKDQPLTNVVTQAQNTCPTFANGAFTDKSCGNIATSAGVLTDPGVQALYISNLAFRRARWAQETFACNKFPAETAAQPVMLQQGGIYTSPWPFTSISGGGGANVDFYQAQTIVCANCHSTINHIAPLFGDFDALGVQQNSIQVTTPIVGLPKTIRNDWLPNGEGTAWRFGVPAPDLPSLGAAIAADPAFAACMVTRVYDWAMSKNDVVNDSATVPDEVIQPYRDDFVKNGYLLKRTIKMAFTSDDFVRF